VTFGGHFSGVVTSCALLMCDLLAIAKFVVSAGITTQCLSGML